MLVKEVPFISIVTPSLNQATYIEENIKSVLNQNYPHFEHIIIDGGSTDGTIDILRKYGHLIWVSEKDNGQSAAINKGFKRARGEIIGWLNSDDCYEPVAFYTVAKELSRAQGKYVVFGDCYTMDEKGKRLAYYKAKLPRSKDWFKYWKKDYVIPSASTFFYKDILEKVGYLDQNLHYTMDDEYWLRVKEFYQFHHIPEPLATVRIHDRMKTISRGDMFEREWFMTLRKHWSSLPLICRYYHLFMALTCRSNSIRMRAYSKIDELSSYEFRKEILLAIIINPLGLFKRRFVSALFRAIIGHHLSDLIKALFIRAGNKLDYLRSIVARTIQKLFLRDFLQVLEAMGNVVFPKKIQYVSREILSRVERLIIRGLFITRFKESKKRVVGIVKTHGFEEVVCCLCGSAEYEVIGTRNGFNNVRCSNCGLGFVTPRYSADARKHFYSWKYNSAGYSLITQFNKLAFVVNEHVIIDQILRVISLYKKKGNLIEIGPFGRGLAREAGKRGFDCWMLKSSGWVYDLPVEDREYLGGNGELSLDGIRFDVVSCLDVLDRIPDPVRELEGINKVMKNDGILLVRVPDFSSTVAEQAGMAWDYNRPWERIYQFDYLSLGKILNTSGFKIVDVKTELSEGVGYPGAMVIIARKRGFRCMKQTPKILLLRDGARGDVLLTTPLIKALKEKYPRSSIIFKTNSPEILSHNPYLEKIITEDDNGEYDLICNLKYELFPEMNYVEAYTRIAKVKAENPQLEFHLTREEQEDGERFLRSLGMERDKLAVLHPMVADRTKSWREEGYQHICQYFLTRNYNVITIGGSKDCTELSGAINLIGKTSIRMAATIISKANFFFGIDSFPMHLASAFRVPSVVLFGPTDPAKVLCPNSAIHAVRSNEKCLGCRHDTTPNKWFQNTSCRRDRQYCMINISLDQAIDAVDRVICMRKQDDRKYFSYIIC